MNRTCKKTEQIYKRMLSFPQFLILCDLLVKSLTGSFPFLFKSMHVSFHQIMSNYSSNDQGNQKILLYHSELSIILTVLAANPGIQFHLT